MLSASSLQAHQDKNPAAHCSGNALANEGPAVLAAADSIADATGLAWASAVVPQRGVTGAVPQADQSHHVSKMDQASLQKESSALPPAEGEDVSSYLCDAPVSMLLLQSDGKQQHLSCCEDVGCLLLSCQTDVMPVSSA